VNTITHTPTLPEGLNLDHWFAWLDDLATTDAPQARGHLAKIVDDGRVGYCCLGRGCIVAGISRYDPSDDDPDSIITDMTLAFAGATDLAPGELLVWLGLWESVADGGEGDIKVAWPTDLCARINDGEEDWPEGMPYHVSIGTAANLNDKGRLTFSQISDVFRYFGTDGATT
jgi:hypothetical protein